MQFLGILIKDVVYIVTEYMPYGDLLGYIRDHSEVTEETLCVMAKQAATGMAYLSQNKIVHRDLALRMKLNSLTLKGIY